MISGIEAQLRVIEELERSRGIRRKGVIPRLLGGASILPRKAAEKAQSAA